MSEDSVSEQMIYTSVTAKTREDFLAEVRKYPEAALFLKTLQERVKRGEYRDTHSDNIQKFEKCDHIVLNVNVKFNGELYEWNDTRYSEDCHPVWASRAMPWMRYTSRNPFMFSEYKGKEYIFDYHGEPLSDGFHCMRDKGYLLPYTTDFWITTAARGRPLVNDYDNDCKCNPVKAMFNGAVVVLYGEPEFDHADSWMMSYPVADFVVAEF